MVISTYIADNDFVLQGYDLTDPQITTKKIEFLTYIRKSGSNETDHFLRNFEAISISNEEYQTIKSKIASLSQTSLFSEHPFFLKSKNSAIHIYDKFQVIENEVTLTHPTILDDGEGNYAIDLLNIDDTILLNDEIIEVAGVILSE